MGSIMKLDNKGKVQLVKQNPTRFINKTFYMIDHRYRVPVQVRIQDVANYKLDNNLFGLLGETNSGTRVVVSEYDLYRFKFFAKLAVYKTNFKESWSSWYHIKSNFKRRLISLIESL